MSKVSVVLVLEVTVNSAASSDEVAGVAWLLVWYLDQA